MISKHILLSLLFLTGLLRTFNSEFVPNPVEYTFSLKVSQSHKYVSPGIEVTLTCTIQTTISPNVTWIRDDELHIEDSSDWGQVSQLQEVDANVYVSVLNLTVSESHSYFCNAQNKYNNAQVKVNIYVGPKPILSMRTEPSAPIYRRGENVTLFCEIKSVELPNVELYLGGALMTNKDEGVKSKVLKGISDNFTSELNLFPFRHSHLIYICKASNKFGKTEVQIEIKTARLSINDKCKDNLDCTTLNAECFKNVCRCPPKRKVYIAEDEDVCLPAVKFQKTCIYSKQCSASDKNTQCTAKPSTCQCKKGFVFSMARKHCIFAISGENFNIVLMSIGVGITVIVIGTLTLYCSRKLKDAKSGKPSTKNVVP